MISKIPAPKKVRSTKAIYKGGTPTKVKVPQGYLRKAMRAKLKSFSLSRRGFK